MGSLGTATLTILADTKQFRTGLYYAQRSALTAFANIRKAIVPVVGALAGIWTSRKVTQGFTYGIQQAREFQEILNLIAATSGTTGAETTTALEQIRQKAIELGKDMHLPATSAQDAANVMYELVKAGLSWQQAVNAAKGTIQMAIAGNLEQADAATAAANMITIYKLRAEDATKVADLFAATANKTSMEMSDMVVSAKYASESFSRVGWSIEDMAAALAMMADNGIRGSTSGRYLRMAVRRLAAPTKEAADLMKKYGISVYDSEGRMRSMDEIAQIFTDRLGKLTDKERDYALAKIFGTEAQTAAGIVFMHGAETLRKYRQELTKGGEAEAIARARTKGLEGAIEGLRSQWETLALLMGEGLTNPIQRLLRLIAAIMERMQGPTEKLSRRLGRSFNRVVSAMWAVYLRVLRATRRGGSILEALLGDSLAARILIGAIRAVVGAIRWVRDTLVLTRKQLGQYTLAWQVFLAAIADAKSQLVQPWAELRNALFRARWAFFGTARDTTNLSASIAQTLAELAARILTFISTQVVPFITRKLTTAIQAFTALVDFLVAHKSDIQAGAQMLRNLLGGALGYVSQRAQALQQLLGGLLDKVSGRWGGELRKISDGFNPMFAAFGLPGLVAGVAQSAYQSNAFGLRDKAQSALAGLQGGAQAAAQGVAAAGEGARAGAGGLLAALADIWEQRVLPVLRQVGSVLGDIWQNVLQPLFKTIADAVRDSLPAFQDSWQNIRDTIPSLLPIMKLLGDILGGLLGGALVGFADTLRVVTWVIKWVMKGLGALAGWLHDRFAPQIRGASQILGYLLSAEIMGGVFSLIGRVGKLLGSFGRFGKVVGWVLRVIAKLGGWISKGIIKAFNFLGGLLGKLLLRFDLFGAGVRFIMGYIDDLILHVAGRVWRKSAQLGQWVLDLGTMVSKGLRKLLMKGMDLLRGGLGKMIRSYLATSGNLAHKLSKLWDDIKHRAFLLWTRVRIWATRQAVILYNKVTEKLQALANDLKGKIWPAIKDAARAAWAWVRDQVKQKVLQLANAAVSQVEGLKNDLRDLWNKVKQKVSSTWADMRDAVKTKAQEIHDWAVDQVTALRNGLRDLWEQVKTKVQTVWETVRTTVRDKVEAVKTKAVETVTGLRDSLRDLWDDAKTKVQNTWESIRSTVTDKISSAKDDALSTVGELRDTLRDRWETIKNKVASAWGEIKDKILGAIGKVLDQFNQKTKFGQRVVNAGKWVLGTIANAVGNAWTRLRDAMIDAVDRAVEGLKNWAKQHNPFGWLGDAFSKAVNWVQKVNPFGGNSASASGPVRAGWTLPIPGAPVTQEFGANRNRLFYGPQGHLGIDFGAAMGTPIRSPLAGQVVFAGWDTTGWGNAVKIRNGPYLVVLGHMSRILARVGQRVTPGQIVGQVGSTGNSTGPHLDVTVYYNGTPINPRSVLPLATGGLVMPRPGGWLANIAEAGEPEAVIPLSKMERMFGPKIELTYVSRRHEGERSVRQLVQDLETLYRMRG